MELALIAPVETVVAKERVGSVAYPAYETYPPYTITYVAELSVSDLNLKEVFAQLPITETSFKAKAGKKVKIDVVGAPGSILAAKYKDPLTAIISVKGINKGTGAFANCITIDATVTGSKLKNVGCKLFVNKLHVAGCLSLSHFTESFDAIKAALCNMVNQEKITKGLLSELALKEIQSEMIDITFSVDFRINRDALKAEIHGVNGFHVIYDCAVHSNGVSVKYPLTPFDGVLRKKMKKKDIPACVSFIVFTSGKVIESGRDNDVMSRVYGIFRETMLLIRERVELRILS